MKQLKTIITQIKNTGFYTIFYLTFLLVKTREFFLKPKKIQVKKLVWFGAYGNTNIGDDLIFFSLRQYIPDNIEISLSCRQLSPTTDYGVHTFYRFDKRQIKEEIRNGDFVILGGGGLFEYYQKLHNKEVTRNVPSYLTTLLYARLSGKKYAIVGIGSNEGPYPNLVLRKVFGDIARNAEFIITRDQKSYNGFLNNGGKRENLTSSYDPVFSLPELIHKRNNKNSVNETKNIGFLIWPFHLHPFFHRVNGMDEIKKEISETKLQAYYQYCTELQKTIEYLEKNNYTVSFPLFHFSDRIILDQLGCKYENEISIDSYFKQIGDCDVIISMRYHGQITSILNNIPVISIPVQEKMTALVENFQLEKYSMELENFNSSNCIAIIEDVLENSQTIKMDLKKNLSKIEKEVKEVYQAKFNDYMQ